MTKPKPAQVPASASHETSVSALRNSPDLTAGACRTEEGSAVMSTYIDKTNRFNAKPAREICRRCPVREACRAWALTFETTAEPWVGMYGGLTPAERQDLRDATPDAAHAA